MKYVYTAWLRDESLPSDDPDHEWPACFVIDGSTEASAKKWGDRLAEGYAGTHGQSVLRSAAEALETSTLPGVDILPVILEGQEAADDDIGW
jgi:hypothetical protein